LAFASAFVILSMSVQLVNTRFKNRGESESPDNDSPQADRTAGHGFAVSQAQPIRFWL
jgi:hypothetical protein